MKESICLATMFRHACRHFSRVLGALMYPRRPLSTSSHCEYWPVLGELMMLREVLDPDACILPVSMSNPMLERQNNLAFV